MFFFHLRAMDYDFGPQHPLKPERLQRFRDVLAAVAPDIHDADPGLATNEDLTRVHSREYVETVAALSSGERVPHGLVSESGFLYGDNPAFPGMYEAALAYTGGSVRAAEAVRDGAPLAFSMTGGLHHARKAQASGFCVFNDCAVACSILRDRFDRVAYVDIDLHHGDGVQWLFYDDPSVLTCSIHQSGRTLYPGTGFVEETGAEFTSVNVPLAPHTAGDAWLWAFEHSVLPALEQYAPQAIVLQMGCDPHFDDPLGHLDVSVQHWLGAVSRVRDLGLPLVALGGGGYQKANVPRMWTGAVLTLLGRDVPEIQPAGVDDDLAGRPFLDPEPLDPSPSSARSEAEGVVEHLQRHVLPNVPRG